MKKLLPGFVTSFSAVAAVYSEDNSSYKVFNCIACCSTWVRSDAHAKDARRHCTPLVLIQRFRLMRPDSPRLSKSPQALLFKKKLGKKRMELRSSCKWQAKQFCGVFWSCVSLFCTLRPSTNVYIYYIYCNILYIHSVCAHKIIFFVIALSLRLLTTRCYVKLMHWAHCSLQATLWAGLLDLLLSCGNSIQRSAALICTALFQHKITSYKHRT